MGLFRFDYTKDKGHARAAPIQKEPEPVRAPAAKRPQAAPKAVKAPAPEEKPLIVDGVPAAMARRSSDGSLVRVRLEDGRSDTGFGWLAVPAGNVRGRTGKGLSFDLGTEGKPSGLYLIEKNGQLLPSGDAPADVAGRLGRASRSDARRREAERINRNVTPGDDREKGDQSWHR